jgi:hypothetical protein
VVSRKSRQRTESVHIRKQQVLGSNPSVGSTPLFPVQTDLLSVVSTALAVAEIRA